MFSGTFSRPFARLFRNQRFARLSPPAALLRSSPNHENQHRKFVSLFTTGRGRSINIIPCSSAAFSSSIFRRPARSSFPECARERHRSAKRDAGNDKPRSNRHHAFAIRHCFEELPPDVSLLPYLGLASATRTMSSVVSSRGGSFRDGANRARPQGCAPHPSHR